MLMTAERLSVWVLLALGFSAVVAYGVSISLVRVKADRFLKRQYWQNELVILDRNRPFATFNTLGLISRYYSSEEKNPVIAGLATMARISIIVFLATFCGFLAISAINSGR